MPNPFEDLSKIYPNLSATNKAVSGDISSQLAGQLSPDTIQGILSGAATFGQTSGMPGSGLARNIIPKDIGLTSQGLQQQGVQNYNQTIPTVSGTQTVSPSLQSDINTQNSVWQSAPDPWMAATHEQGVFQDYLDQMNPSGNQVTWAGKGGSGTADLTTPQGMEDYFKSLTAAG